MDAYESGDEAVVARREADRPARRADCIGRSSILSWCCDGLSATARRLIRVQLMVSEVVPGWDRGRTDHNNAASPIPSWQVDRSSVGRGELESAGSRMSWSAVMVTLQLARCD